MAKEQQTWSMLSHWLTGASSHPWLRPSLIGEKVKNYCQAANESESQRPQTASLHVTITAMNRACCAKTVWTIRCWLVAETSWERIRYFCLSFNYRQYKLKYCWHLLRQKQEYVVKKRIVKLRLKKYLSALDCRVYMYRELTFRHSSRPSFLTLNVRKCCKFYV